MFPAPATSPLDHDRSPDESIGDLLVMIRAEYRRDAGAVQTCPQLCRLFAIDVCTCEAAMRILVGMGLIVRGADGSSRRRRPLM